MLSREYRTMWGGIASRPFLATDVRHAVTVFNENSHTVDRAWTLYHLQELVNGTWQWVK